MPTGFDDDDERAPGVRSLDPHLLRHLCVGAGVSPGPAVGTVRMHLRPDHNDDSVVSPVRQTRQSWTLGGPWAAARSAAGPLPQRPMRPVLVVASQPLVHELLGAARSPPVSGRRVRGPAVMLPVAKRCVQAQRRCLPPRGAPWPPPVEEEVGSVTQIRANNGPPQDMSNPPHSCDPHRQTDSRRTCTPQDNRVPRQRTG